jgi:hypothetical protein
VSSYMVAAAVTRGLRTILWDEFDSDDVIRPIVGGEAGIVFRNPTETARDSAHRLSIWLYQISENEFVKNQPMLRTSNDDESRFPPLAINLSYLLTPFGSTSEADQLLLGKAMQVLHDTATFFLRDAASDIAEELRVVFRRMTLEELTRIWDALREPYRLSVCYEVRVARIDSNRIPEHARVLDRIAGFADRSAPGAGDDR